MTAKRKKAQTSKSKGKRYNATVKRAVVRFVAEYNDKHGRGGITAASKTYAITPLTIGNWVKAHNLPFGKGSAHSISSALKELAKIASEIESLEAEIARKKSRFNQLKKSL